MSILTYVPVPHKANHNLIRKWLTENVQAGNYVPHEDWDLIQSGNQYDLRLGILHGVGFYDAREAMLFKLAWGGSSPKPRVEEPPLSEWEEGTYILRENSARFLGWSNRLLVRAGDYLRKLGGAA